MKKMKEEIIEFLKSVCSKRDLKNELLMEDIEIPIESLCAQAKFKKPRHPEYPKQ